MISPLYIMTLIVGLICLGLGYLLRKYFAESKIIDAEALAKRIIREAEKDAETKRKEASLGGQGLDLSGQDRVREGVEGAQNLSFRTWRSGSTRERRAWTGNWSFSIRRRGI